MSNPNNSQDNPASQMAGFVNPFHNVNDQNEMTTTPFYRWFILNCIHKRQFKHGAFISQIPWIPSGPTVWRIETILTSIASSQIVTDEERSVIQHFLIEYEKCLTRQDKLMSSDLNMAWDVLKRMFDLNDPTHIAGQIRNRKPAQKYAPIPVRENTAYDVDKEIEEELMEGLSLWDRESHPQVVEEVPEVQDTTQSSIQRGVKRIVSGTAIGSTSPTKKAKPIVHVTEISGSDDEQQQFRNLALRQTRA